MEVAKKNMRDLVPLTLPGVYPPRDMDLGLIDQPVPLNLTTSGDVENVKEFI